MEKNVGLEAQGHSAESNVVDIKNMLDAGVHFGHQTHRWNPKMAPYIYGVRNDVHIINLDISYQAWEKGRKAIHDIVSRGGNILFVGTKRQGRDIIKEEAVRCGAFFVTNRWLGGTLTNFPTIKNSIDRMKKMEEFLKKAQEGTGEVRIKKKEQMAIAKSLEKLEANLGGIRDMKRVPDVLFVVDVVKENIAIAEAWKLKIPVVALVDTNASPDQIEYPIPANDDATRTIKLFSSAVADVVLQARAIFKARSGDKSEAGSSIAKNGHSHKGSDDIAIPALGETANA